MSEKSAPVKPPTRLSPEVARFYAKTARLQVNVVRVSFSTYIGSGTRFMGMKANTVFFLAVLLLVVFTGCKQTERQHGQSNRQYFSDIDIFNIQGVGLLPKDKFAYPAFAIDSINESERNITFLLSRNIKYTHTYFRKDSCWQAKLNYIRDTCYSITYTYALPGKIVQLDYDSAADYGALLCRFSVLENNVDTLYLLTRPVKGVPTRYYEKYLSYPISGKVITKYSLGKDAMKIITVQKDLIANSERIDSTSYLPADHSILWWQHFESYQQRQ